MDTQNISNATSDRIFPPHSAPVGIDAKSINHDRAFAELNGLAAGLRCPDLEMPPAKARRQLPSFQNTLQLDSSNSNAGASSLLDLPLNEIVRIEAPALPGPESGRPAPTKETMADIILSIRYIIGFANVLWKDLTKKLTAIERQVSPSNIHPTSRDFEDALAFREAGIRAMKEMLTGTAPKTLHAMLAFTSLSYVILNLLDSREKIVKQDVLANLFYWTYSFLDFADARRFKIVVSSLWPEADSQLTFLDVGSESPWNPLLATGPDQGQQHNLHHNFASEETSSAAMQRFLTGNYFQPVAALQPSQRLAKFVSDLFEHCHGEFAWHQFLGSNHHNAAEQERSRSHFPIGSNHHVPNQHFRAVGSHVEPDDNRMMNMVANPAQTKVQEVTITTPLQWDEKMNHARQRFIELHKLSPSARRRDNAQPNVQPFENIKALGERQKTKDRIRKEVLDPLDNNGDLNSPCCRTLLLTARELVDEGYLQTIPKAQEYLVTVGKVGFDYNAKLSYANNLQESCGETTYRKLCDRVLGPAPTQPVNQSSPGPRFQTRAPPGTYVFSMGNFPHLLTSNSRGPFPCGFCTARFSNPSNRKRHHDTACTGRNRAGSTPSPALQ